MVIVTFWFSADDKMFNALIQTQTHIFLDYYRIG